MKDLLTNIMEQLRQEVPELRYISEDWGQLDFYKDTPPVKFPCALVSIGQIQFEELGKEADRARITLQIRLADAPATFGNVAAPQKHIEQAFSLLGIVMKVDKALVGMRVGSFSRIGRQGIVPAFREDTIREYAMTLKTRTQLETGY